MTVDRLPLWEETISIEKVPFLCFHTGKAGVYGSISTIDHTISGTEEGPAYSPLSEE